MELSKINKKYTSILELVDSNKIIKWTNRYDCPPGYMFNSDGWIETSMPFPKITVSFLPHLLSGLGEYELLLQNLLALRLLNDRPHEELEFAIRNRFKQAYLGRLPDPEVFDKVVEASRLITNTTDLPPICDDMVKFDTIWHNKNCSEGGRVSIKKVIRNNYISAIRSMMSIRTKYKTDEVMEETDLSKYAVGAYWKKLGLDSKNRTMSAIVEAIEEVSEVGLNPTQDVIAEIAGVSIRSIQRYKEMWMLQK